MILTLVLACPVDPRGLQLVQELRDAGITLGVNGVMKVNDTIQITYDGAVEDEPAITSVVSGHVADMEFDIGPLLEEERLLPFT